MADNFDPTQKNRELLDKIFRSSVPSGSALGQQFADEDQAKLDEMATDEANNLVMTREPVSPELEEITNPIKSLPSRAPAEESLSEERLNRMDPSLRKIIEAKQDSPEKQAYSDYSNSPAAKARADFLSKASGQTLQQQQEPVAPEKTELPAVAPKDLATPPINPNPSPASKLPEQAPAAPKEEGPNFLKMMEDAQDREANELRDAKWLRASELMGAGLARITPNHESSDLARKAAGLHGERAKSRVGAIKEQQGYDKAQQEVTDDKALRDPNSEISKHTVAQLAKYGINVKTAMEAKLLSPHIFNLTTQDLSHKKDMKVAAMSLEASKNKQTAALSDKQRKFGRDLRKEATTGQLGKQYATYSTSRRMTDAITQFAKDPSGYTDYASLMGGLKTLQGDESVVREAEMRLGMQAGSLKDRFETFFSKQASGKSLSDSQRKELIKTVNILADLSKNQYMQSVKPILEQADMEGIPHNMILSGSLSGEDKSSEKEGAAPSNRTFKKAQAPGSVVTTKSGKKYKIGSDGVTGSEIP